MGKEKIKITSLMHFFCEKNNYLMVRVMLRKGCMLDLNDLDQMPQDLATNKIVKSYIKVLFTLIELLKNSDMNKKKILGILNYKQKDPNVKGIHANLSFDISLDNVYKAGMQSKFGIGYTLYHLIAMNGDSEILKAFLKKGQDIGSPAVPDCFGETPLRHTLRWNMNFDFIKALIEHAKARRINVEKLLNDNNNLKGETALDLVIPNFFSNGDQKIGKAKKITTGLFFNAPKEFMDLINYLRSHGAKTSAELREKSTPNLLKVQTDKFSPS